LAIGIGCMVDDFKAGGITPYEMLDQLKNHPVIKPLLAGSEVKEYAAHLIPEGGYNSIPSVYGDGWMIVGDSGGFVNAVHREGSNLAMTTGRLAAETIIALKAEGKACIAKHLARYRAALDDSFVMKDLKKYKNMPGFLDNNRQFFTTYPEMLSKAANTMLRVDGVDKLTKEKQITKNFRQRRTVFGLVGDAVKLVRAFR
ncbi:MAG TPA: FAD-dependent oxidoreductase, partial [Patescibacteria group bacterium]|nr:FAD-dependent oxidoreductase [Patescibacteria group bacterium]